MKRIKVLAIAPYEGMKELMLNVSEKRKDIDLTVFVGDTLGGIEIAKTHQSHGYSAIISRGGTANVIRSVANIPVIEISFSVYDVLRAIKLAQNCCKNFAIIGVESITNCARTLCSVLQYEIDIFTIKSGDANETESIINRIKKDCTLILGDMGTITKAKALGVDGILITSGTEGIELAIDQVVRTCKDYNEVLMQNELFSSVIEACGYETVAFAADGTVKYQSTSVSEQLLKAMLGMVPSLFEKGALKRYKTINGKSFLISGKRLSTERDYVAFYVSPVNACQENTPGIRVLSKSECICQTENEKSVPLAELSLVGSIAMFKKIGGSHIPVLIRGERGVGKDCAAQGLYLFGCNCGNSFILIDCKAIEDKQWNALIDRESSPFYENSLTFYFKEIDSLLPAQWEKLCRLLSNSGLLFRNRLIFAQVAAASGVRNDRCKFLLEKANCLELYLPPLRSRKEELPDLISLYINDLNARYARHIIGFGPESMAMMKAYKWNGNLAQLKTVVRKLVLTSGSAYITAADTEKAIACEMGESRDLGLLDTSRPLAEIEFDLVKGVLKECGGNHTKCAKRLEISRSTLWRILKAAENVQK